MTALADTTAQYSTLSSFKGALRAGIPGKGKE